MRKLFILALLCGLCCAQTSIKGQQVVVTGSGSIFVFVASLVEVVPSTVGAPVGGTVPFTALFDDNLGNSTPACLSTGWASSSPSTATINAATGVATAVAPGTTTISCTASGLVGNATLTVEAAPNFTTPSLPCANPCPLVSGQVGVAYSYQLAAGGGSAPYTFSLVSGTPPNGINSPSSVGLLAGTPTAAGTSTFTIQVCDSLSVCSPTLSVSITVAASGSFPDYTPARTDLIALTQPSVPPQMGPNVCTAGSLNACGNFTGIGNCETDTDFGYQVCRVTDTTTPPVTNTHFKTITVASSGSGDENRWNPTSTMLVVDDWGARGVLLNFTDTGTAMSTTRRYASDPLWSASGGFWYTGPAFWSRNVSTPNILYNLPATGTTLKHWDFSNPTTAPTSQTQDFDFASCLATASGQSPFVVTWTTNGGNNNGDDSVAFGFSNNGGQQSDGARYLAVWTRGSGCRVLNVATLTVSGDWGPTGAITGTTCTVGRIHNVKIMKGTGTNGGVLVTLDNSSGGSACPDSHSSPFVWQYATLNFTPVCGGQCSGHFTEAIRLWANNTGNLPPFFWSVRDFASPSSPTGLTPSMPPGTQAAALDFHPSWNQGNDAQPFFTSTFTACAPPTRAWSEEILGMWPYLAAPMRFAKTLHDSCSNEFGVEIAVGSVSQDGKYYAYTSDWMGTLGGDQGTATCTPGAANGGSWVANGSNALGRRASFTINNPALYIYQVTTAGTSGATRPTFNQTIGGTTTDGTAVWTNMGPRCRGDVFVVRLTK
jgi:hypothetical protein